MSAAVNRGWGALLPSLNSWPWLRLATGMAGYPFRILGLGMEMMARTGREAGRLLGGGSEDAVSRGYLPAGGGSAVTQTRPAPVGAVDPLTRIPKTPKRKESQMSCESDLSGNDLKVIQYSIVSVSPYLSDYDDDDDNGDRFGERVLFGPSTVSTTQDMTESAFTAWVIALNIQKEPNRVPESQKPYLRVCYSVQCRLPMPEPNYPKKQLWVSRRQLEIDRQQRDALWAINQTLKDKHPRDSASSGGAGEDVDTDQNPANEGDTGGREGRRRGRH